MLLWYDIYYHILIISHNLRESNNRLSRGLFVDYRQHGSMRGSGAFIKNLSKWCWISSCCINPNEPGKFVQGVSSRATVYSEAYSLSALFIFHGLMNITSQPIERCFSSQEKLLRFSRCNHGILDWALSNLARASSPLFILKLLGPHQPSNPL
jgi:hypothetical protein